MAGTLKPPTALSLDFGSAGIRLTPEEFDAIEQYDEKYRYELIRGVLVVNPIPGAGQTSPDSRLTYYLVRYQLEHPNGAILDDTMAEQFIHLPDSRRIADRVVWTGLGRAPDTRHDVPSIAIEFVSASRRDHRRDYIEKSVEYMSAGVLEYWIIDRFKRCLTVHRQGMKKPIVVPENQNYSTDLLPGFELPLGEILSVADRYIDS